MLDLFYSWQQVGLPVHLTLMTKPEKDPADYIMPLHINGLDGRMLYMPAPKGKTRNIMFVYGQHASLERQFGVMQVLNKYGSVTMPDLPGFGGMESFYKIGMKPTIDNLADYLAAFVKLRYKRKKVTILAMSLGFAITTRMLQRCPELVGKVNLLVSVVGFVHHEEFIFSRRNFLLMRYGASFFSNRIPAYVGEKLFLRPSVIRATYNSIKDANPKLKDANDEERKKRIDFEIHLWQINDIRTYMDVSVSMFRMDLLGTKIDMPVYHIGVDEDRYFDNHIVEQHMNIVFNKVTMIDTDFKGHGPTVIADAKSASAFIPPKLKRLLSHKP